MTETEMKLTLLRYNMLAKKKATAAHMCKHTDADECIHYGDEWSECTIEMRKMKDDLRKDGYKFDCNDIKKIGEEYYGIYRVVPLYTTIY